MSERIEKVNELLLHEIATLINREVKASGFLITVTYVKCASDLKHANVGISILPDNKTGSGLRAVRSINSLIHKELKKKLNLKYIPKLHFSFDDTEKNAAVIEDIIDQIKHEKK